jgi:hypothetical protein
VGATPPYLWYGRLCQSYLAPMHVERHQPPLRNLGGRERRIRPERAAPERVGPGKRFDRSLEPSKKDPDLLCLHLESIKVRSQAQEKRHHLTFCRTRKCNQPVCWARVQLRETTLGVEASEGRLLSAALVAHQPNDGPFLLHCPFESAVYMISIFPRWLNLAQGLRPILSCRT